MIMIVWIVVTKAIRGIVFHAIQTFTFAQFILELIIQHHAVFHIFIFSMSILVRIVRIRLINS